MGKTNNSDRIATTRNPRKADPVMETLRRQGFRFKKDMGQHFLFNNFILEQIVDLAGIEAGDVVIEAGAGAGSLSERLAKREAHVIAIEIDRTLIPFLHNRFQPYPAVEIVQGDVMKLDMDHLAEDRQRKTNTPIGPYKLCANLPYNISTAFITMCFRQLKNLGRGAVLLQKEVADKVTARPGEDSYGMLSLAANWYGNVEQAMDIDASYFTPQPPVDSTLITFSHRPRTFDVEEKALWLVIRTLYNQRRKNVQNGLKSLGPFVPRNGATWVDILKLTGIDPQRRPETLSLQEFVDITRTAGYTSES